MSHRRHLFKQPEKMCEHLCWPSKRVEKKTIIKYHSQKRSFHFISFQFNSLFVFVSLSRHAMSGLESCERKQKDIWKQINDFRTYLVATTTMNNNIVLIYFMLKVKVRCFKLSSQKMMQIQTYLFKCFFVNSVTTKQETLTLTTHKFTSEKLGNCIWFVYYFLLFFKTFFAVAQSYYDDLIHLLTN